MYPIRQVLSVFATLLLLLELRTHRTEGQQLLNKKNPTAPYQVQVKVSAFNDPNTGYVYKLASYNQSTFNGFKSFIKVYKIKKSDLGRNRPDQAEDVQTIPFKSSLVDFDLHCQPTHCYLVAVTSKSKTNVELFTWRRTQFDSLMKRDIFAQPKSVKIFKIQSSFYIAIAQEQLHLPGLHGDKDDDGEPNKFIGCAILKFVKGYETGVKYQQFIKLPFHPLHVYHFTSSSQYINSTHYVKPQESHYLVFSQNPRWNEPNSGQALSFIWSPLNDLFWPYKLPERITITEPSDKLYPILKFPPVIEPLPPKENLTRVFPVEACFSQLQRLLTDREIFARKLIDSSKSLWRSNDGGPPTSISARVIVHGDVHVRGSLIESPQLTLIGHQPAPIFIKDQIIDAVDAHSPALVENKLRQASFKLKHIRDKLARAVTISSASYNKPGIFESNIRFLGTIQANDIIFQDLGIANSNVRLNGVSFDQLEHELVGLTGVQDVPVKVIFKGNVIADLLEIHGRLNQEYFLRDAIDIRSNRLQIIDTSRSYITDNEPYGFNFASIATKEVILNHNVSLNDISLGDFITRDNRTQLIFGNKIFKHLSIDRLNLAHRNILLNGHNISNIISKAIYLKKIQPQYINGDHVSFGKPVRAGSLQINNMINRNINITSLIHDSVKSNEMSVQQITGHKYFSEGLTINHLTTDGAINKVPIRDVFNLNPHPPISEYSRYNSVIDNIITGNVDFNSTVVVTGNMNVNLVNGVDISKRAIRRHSSNSTAPNPIQFVSGKKLFFKPLRILNQVRLLNSSKIGQGSPYPSINGFDIKAISAGIARQVLNPPIIYIDNLEIDGNLNLPSSSRLAGPQFNRTTIGNYMECPLDLIRSKVIVGGNVDQVIDAPIRMNTLRARSISLDPGALNDLNFPQDFVLKSAYDGFLYSEANQSQVEPIFGNKYFNHLDITPSIPIQQYGHRSSNQQIQNQLVNHINIVFGPRSSINDINYDELQALLSNERKRHPNGGETVLQTLNVYGNIHARRINGHYWPEDILLKSISSSRQQPIPPYLHKRIYSPLVFSESSFLRVESQLVLRGPIQLKGKLNGQNLTEFARQSATYGDKDLLSIGRPIQNKIFLGGLTVTGQISSQGFIDGLNFDAMRNRVVTINKGTKQQRIYSPKIFMSDIDFLAPISIVFLNDLPINQYINRINIEPNGDNVIRILGKKTVSGTLVIRRQMFVDGLINGHDFTDLRAKAILLNNSNDNLTFNKTLTIEGDVFMDNLIIDEKNGIIDGVKLTNLLPLNATIGDRTNELIVLGPAITTQGVNHLNLVGQLNDCQISCSLSRAFNARYQRQTGPPTPIPHTHRPQQYTPSTYFYQARNISPPPYAQDQHQQAVLPLAYIADNIQSLAQRRPVSIHYEPVRRKYENVPTSIIDTQLDYLRNQIPSFSLLPKSTNNLVVGFIDAFTNDVSGFSLPDQAAPHFDHNIKLNSFITLDQVDFPFTTTIYHLAVGARTSRDGRNVTFVYSSIGGSDINQVSQLPIESPNAAMFLRTEGNILFLLVSEDYGDSLQCPRYWSQPNLGGGVHVYLFHALHNSSLLTSAYFDLYQTIDLSAIDSFDSFEYHGATYVVAVSRLTSKIHILVLRGYSGFQLVSSIEAPDVDYIRMLYHSDRPALIIYKQNGLHQLMESVVI